MKLAGLAGLGMMVCAYGAQAQDAWPAFVPTEDHTVIALLGDRSQSAHVRQQGSDFFCNLRPQLLNDGTVTHFELQRCVAIMTEEKVRAINIYARAERDTPDAVVGGLPDDLAGEPDVVALVEALWRRDCTITVDDRPNEKPEELMQRLLPEVWKTEGMTVERTDKAFNLLGNAGYLRADVVRGGRDLELIGLAGC